MTERNRSSCDLPRDSNRNADLADPGATASGFHSALPERLLTQWKEDVSCVFERDPAARNRLEVLSTYPGVHAILLHRLSHRLWRRGWLFLARCLAFLGRWLTNVDIHPGAQIGRRFFIDHGAGVVIGETTVIGDDVTLYHGVTLGGTSWNKGRRHPSLGNGVLVGAGAKVLGPIELGENVRVGANSVVVKNVPANKTVVGIPGRIVQSREAIGMNPSGVHLDHNRIPDLINQTMSELLDRIATLEKRLALADAPVVVAAEAPSFEEFDTLNVSCCSPANLLRRDAGIQ